MGRGTAERVALMAIHEKWAEAILDGHKRVEFRKRRLAPDINTVLVYATAPISKVIGQFTVERIATGTPAEIWDTYGAVGVIEESAFFSYYENSESAVAIVVAEATRFAAPVPLDDFEPKPAVPQSFAYVAPLAAAG